MRERKDLFGFMLERVEDVARETGLRPPQAFVNWFVELFYDHPHDLFVSDGSQDGKVDAFFSTSADRSVTHHVINSKFTKTYNKVPPVQYYDEITRFANLFLNAAGRDEYLVGAVKAELRPHYRRIFDAYDDGRAELLFLTNHRLDEARIGHLPDVRVVQLNDLVQHIVDDIDGAMPRTDDLVLSGIQTVLPAHRDDTEVPTSIVFARLVDFISYMKDDPFDLLFARNVRVPVPLSRSEANRSIKETFQHRPTEFVYSNNGITVLCEGHRHNPGPAELTLINPRVVNGSQTLHSIRDVPSPSKNARVMVRVIEIPPLSEDDLPERIRDRKRIIDNITVRSNQQNPMKKFNLVSNDEFQMTLFRFFRQQGFFYQRREREWAQRSRELRSIGIQKGPGIKKLAQLIASFHAEKTSKGLGPANAKVAVGKLFEQVAYEEIRKVKPDLAFQLFLVSEDIDDVYREAAAGRKGLRDIRGHANLTLFALLTSAIQTAGGRWGHPSMTDHLLDQWETWDEWVKPWRLLVEEGARGLLGVYKAESRGRDELTMNNFFKNKTHVDVALGKTNTTKLRRLARGVIA